MGEDTYNVLFDCFLDGDSLLSRGSDSNGGNDTRSLAGGRVSDNLVGMRENASDGVQNSGSAGRGPLVLRLLGSLIAIIVIIVSTDRDGDNSDNGTLFNGG